MSRDIIRILILGAGEIGQALGYVLKRKENIYVDLWDADPSKEPGQKDLSETAPHADIVFLCTPANKTSEAVDSVRTYLEEKTPLISLSKGFDDEGRRVDEVLREELSDENFGLLYGPMIAEELCFGTEGFGVCAAGRVYIGELVRKIFEGTCVHVEITDDVAGVAISGIVKNVYAILVGMTDALELDDNLRGYLLGEAVKEGEHIVTTLGGKRDTYLGPAGLADLFATGFSPYSTNRRSGVNKARGEDVSQKGEGMRSIEMLTSALSGKESKYPLLFLLHRVMVEGRDARDELRAFMRGRKL